jgi:hypothetical protein
MKRALLLLVSSFLLTSCGDKVSGRLDMALDLLVKTTRGTKQLSGSYDFELKASSKNSGELLLYGPNDVKHTLKFKSSNTTIFPENGNGAIFVSGIENSQNFDLVGRMQTTRTVRDAIERDYEQCSYTRQRQVCQYDQYGRPYCYIVNDTVWGRRQVEYSTVTTHQNLTIDMKLINDGRIAGTLSSETFKDSRDYHYVGNCW